MSIHAEPYRVGPEVQEADEDEIENMLAMKVVESVQTERASPIVLVPMKALTLQFRADYRKLNAATTRDSCPLPLMDECTDSLGDDNTFFILDGNSNYWQIEEHKSDSEKTAFSSHHELYQFTRMLFGLRNGTLHFEVLWMSYCLQ